MTVTKQVLISVYNKTGVVEFARELISLGFTILSTGGTAEALRKAGLSAVEISTYTGHPEILGGRVKTLHPRVHGGILADPSVAQHRSDLSQTGIELIDLVVVNLYPFREVAARHDASPEEIIEMIDIGGPAMVRSAAKNHRRVGVVVDPSDYPAVATELRTNGDLGRATRVRLAAKAFAHTAAYDAAIRDELPRRIEVSTPPRPEAADSSETPFPERLTINLKLSARLRYGENPHQRGALYEETGADPATIAGARQLQGKDLSFNNLLDLDAAWRLALEFPVQVAVIVKHNNPCGVAAGETLLEAFENARRTDPVSAFGGIVAFNRDVDAAAAGAVAALFLECVIAPGFAAEAMKLLSARSTLRVMQAATTGAPYCGFDLRRVTGGLLAQDWDRAATDLGHSRSVTRRPASPEELRALDFAWRVSKRVKSNAIVLARDRRTVGIGAGQMSRVDSVRLAVQKSQEPTRGTVLASDAFFPFRDGLDEAARAGVTAIVQPGGSVKDSEVIAAADEHGLAMVFTSVRHFRH